MLTLKVMGIDPSLACTGMASNEYGCVSAKSSPKFKEIERVHQVTQAVMHQVDKMKPDLIVIETAVVASNHGVQMGVLFLHGVIRYEIYDTYGPQIPVVDLHNLSLKKFACGDQKLRDKSQVLMRALAKGGPVSNEDEADAFWCMQAGVAAYERVDDQQALPYYRQEVLSGVDWPEIQGVKPKWIKPKKSAARKKLPMTLEG